ncbi:FUSC family protein [Streptomyces sp. J2-1]|uniref:FUSC family protein n=1 Tax=Streptomyces corallincola TaxID=2851888 RepID=UPI001C387C17|nr:FUSC family protein [Streptomyces corallincola]MBV2353855.1 FUSC family protein [Streptomyces corallincola]
MTPASPSDPAGRPVPPRQHALSAKLLRTRSAPQRFRTATIAGVCMALPMALAFGAGRPGLGAVGGLGSLAALYGRPGPPARDARAVAFATLGLAAGFLLCSTAQGHAWLAVLVTAGWAGVVTVVCGAFAARPPGIVMPVLVGAVATALPPGDPLPLTGAVAATGLLATLLVWGSAALRDVRARHTATPSAPTRPTRGTPGDLTAPHRSARHLFWRPHVHILGWAGLRTAAGVGLAGVLSLAVGAPHPFWALAAAAAVLAAGNQAASVNDRALLRGAGTLAGCLVAGGVFAAAPGPTAIVVLLALFAFVTECVVARNYALAMVFVTPMGILLSAVASPVAAGPWALTGERLLQTVLGCVGAVAVGQLVTVRWAVARRLQAVRGVLRAAADVVAWPEPDGPGAARAELLGREVRHLALVSERVAGERRSVREGTARLDAVVAGADAVAREALRRRAAAGDGDQDYAESLRALAALLDTQHSENGQNGLLKTQPAYESVDLANLSDSVRDWIFTRGIGAGSRGAASSAEGFGGGGVRMPRARI